MTDDPCEVLGALLSGYVDDELTQEKRQFVEVHGRRCEECRQRLEELRALKARFNELDLGEVPTHTWRERMDEPVVTTTRSVGWILSVGAILLAGAYGVVDFFSSDATALAKIIVTGVYGGLALLLVSVVRQRLIERKTDKYEDVEI